jgi:hypothetical protein
MEKVIAILLMFLRSCGGQVSNLKKSYIYFRKLNNYHSQGELL